MLAGPWSTPEVMLLAIRLVLKHTFPLAITA